MANPRLFISFTGRDMDFVRRLISRLKSPAQDLDVWLYEDAGDELDWGKNIPDQLVERLALADVFVPIVSPAAFTSAYTCFEVDAALKTEFQGEQKVILPIVSDRLREVPTADWAREYRVLAASRFRFLDFGSLTQLEEVVFDICSELHVEYRPLVLQDARLPFLDLFVQEIRELCPQRAEHGIGIYRRLMIVFNEFEANFESQDFTAAEQLMSYFCTMCEYEYPNVRLYYPRVVHAVCHLQLDQLDAARDIFEALQHHAYSDETVLGGLGLIHQQQGAYELAIEFYEAAHQLKPDDAAARNGVIVNRILNGQMIDVDADLDWLDRSTSHSSEDADQIQALRVFAYANSGRLDDAIRCFTELERSAQKRSTQVETATVLHVAQRLAERNLPQAVHLLERYYRTRTDDVDLVHSLMMYCGFAGDTAQAYVLAQQLITLAPGVRQYRMDAAQIAWAAQQYGRAHKFVRPLLDRAQFKLPVSCDDFYCDGFANWILGNRDRAEYDFERSGFSANQHYSRLVDEIR